MRQFFTAFALAALLAASGSATAQKAPALPSFAPIIKRASPAVVNIAVLGTVTERGNQYFGDEGLRRFFGLPPQMMPREREFRSVGSGVVVDARQGYIVTNAHVLENAKEITVTLVDDRELKAEIVGSDPRSDVAVLRVKDAKLPAEMPLADSSRLEVGDFVIAIGNPFGLQHTITSGIVSALGRSGFSRDNVEDFIQTDAAINPGNSGGALVSLSGELVGINSVILSPRSGTNIGLGFAIPSNMVKTVMSQLIEFGEVNRGQLGVKTLTLSPEIRRSLGLAEDLQGALVTEVAEGSAAARAGIQASDVITAVGGQAVKGGGDLRNIVGMQRVGDRIEIALLRDGQVKRVAAVLREPAQLADAAEIHAALAGAELVESQDGAGTGVVIRAVQPGSAAAQAGLLAGDRIVAVNRSRIDTLAHLREATKGQGSLFLQLQRGNQLLLLPLH